MKVTEIFPVISNAGGIQTDIAALIKALGNWMKAPGTMHATIQSEKAIRRYPIDYKAVSASENAFAYPHERNKFMVEFIRSGIKISNVAPYTHQPMADMLWGGVVQELRENV